MSDLFTSQFDTNDEHCCCVVVREKLFDKFDTEDSEHGEDIEDDEHNEDLRKGLEQQFGDDDNDEFESDVGDTDAEDEEELDEN